MSLASVILLSFPPELTQPSQHLLFNMYVTVDRSGKFITEADVQARVAQMQQSRSELLYRLHRDRIDAESLAEKRRKAHEEDMKSGAVKKTKASKASVIDTA